MPNNARVQFVIDILPAIVVLVRFERQKERDIQIGRENEWERDRISTLLGVGQLEIVNKSQIENFLILFIFRANTTQTWEEKSGRRTQQINIVMRHLSWGTRTDCTNRRRMRQNKKTQWKIFAIDKLSTYFTFPSSCPLVFRPNDPFPQIFLLFSFFSCYFIFQSFNLNKQNRCSNAVEIRLLFWFQGNCHSIAAVSEESVCSLLATLASLWQRITTQFSSDQHSRWLCGKARCGS